MLKKAGLTEGTDYQTALLDGFDPKVHIAIPEIVGFPGFKSNEPLQLEAAGIPFKLYDPADYGIPGSFGVLYTNSTFLKDFPTAAADFMRASMKGLADALADPKAAAEIAVDMINANGNANHLSADGEIARWNVESGLILNSKASAVAVRCTGPGVADQRGRHLRRHRVVRRASSRHHHDPRRFVGEEPLRRQRQGHLAVELDRRADGLKFAARCERVRCRASTARSTRRPR